MALPLPGPKVVGAAFDAGALEADEPIYGEGGRIPTIPQWLLDEWPQSKRGQ